MTCRVTESPAPRGPRLSPGWLAVGLSVGLHLLFALLIFCWPTQGWQTPTAPLSIDCVSYGEEEETAPGGSQQPPAATPQPPPPAPESQDLTRVVTVPDEGPPTTAGPATEGTGEGTGNQSGPGGRGFFQVTLQGQRIVYVIDRSSSMGEHGALEAACRELLTSLAHLPATARFQVVLYNRSASPLLLGGRTDLAAAGADSLRQVETALAALRPAGGTSHVSAIKTALTLLPDVLFLVTDADDLTQNEVRELTALNRGRAVIHAVELTPRPEQGDGPLALLAHGNGGTYRVVNPEVAAH
jgi:hypothetical protein